MGLAEQIANESNFSFMTDVIVNDNCPDFNGYNTRLCREQRIFHGPKTNAVYFSKAQKLTKEIGQNFTLLTADQQLYRIAVEVHAMPGITLNIVKMHS